MIQNLNQVAFQRFGVTLPEHKQLPQTQQFQEQWLLNAGLNEIPLYQATVDTYLSLRNGKSILSVSFEKESFDHFYFDKHVCIRAGTYFFLSPFKGDATVLVCASSAPKQIGNHPISNLRIDRNLRIDGIYTFFYQEREQGFIFSGEDHPMPELTYVDRGELHSVTEGEDILLKQGDIAFFGPNQWHMHYADIGVAPQYVTISFDLEGADITPLLNRKFCAPQSAVSLIHQMLREQEQPDRFSSDMIISYLSTLVLTLLRHADTPGTKPKASNTIHSENEIIQRAQRYISTHIREKLSVPLIAKMVGISPSYLAALFHKHLQISPGEYVRRIKLQESKQMIREGHLNFTEISATLQYSTVQHFSRQFKEKFGITPSEYAKSVR